MKRGNSLQAEHAAPRLMEIKLEFRSVNRAKFNARFTDATQAGIGNNNGFLGCSVFCIFLDKY